MIKLNIKYVKTRKNCKCSYITDKTNSYEHLYGIAVLYNELKINTNLSDKEITKCIKLILKDFII